MREDNDICSGVRCSSVHKGDISLRERRGIPLGVLGRGRQDCPHDEDFERRGQFSIDTRNFTVTSAFILRRSLTGRNRILRDLPNWP